MPTTINLPGGGTATFRDMGELPPRARRRLKPYVLALSDRLAELSAAATITVNGATAAADARLKGASVSLSLAEADLLTDMQDQTTLALLATWSLGPVPTTLDELLDVDDVHDRPGLYDALSEQAAKIGADAVAGGGFTVAAVEDPASPIGA